MDSTARDFSQADRALRVVYPGQFDLAPDPLHIAIPREEIVEAMARQGEDRTMNQVCMAVAVVLDALGIDEGV